MDLEYLVVGLARGNKIDFQEFYRCTAKGVFSLSLAYLGDRNLAREAAVETYRRAETEASRFDTDMSAEYWLLDICKNLCINGMCDGEIAAKAARGLRDNLTILLSKALYETDEDRGKILTLRCGSKLSKNEAANLLWYRQGSADGEYRRGLQQAADLAQWDEKDGKEIAAQLEKDLEAACPEFFEAIWDGVPTSFARITHEDLFLTENEQANPGETQEARIQRVKVGKAAGRRRKFRKILVACACVLLVLGVGLGIYFIRNRDTLIRDTNEVYSVVEPKFRASVALILKDGALFYGNYGDGGTLYRYDLKTGENRRISQVLPKDFCDGGDVIYFRNASKGELSVLDPATSEVRGLGVKGALPQKSGDGIVFSSVKGVAVRNGAGEISEIFENTDGAAYRYDLVSGQDGTVYFSASPSQGLYRISCDPEVGYYSDVSFPDYEICDIEILNGYLFFEDGAGTLHGVNMTGEEGANLITVRGSLKYGSFAMDGNEIYFYGRGEGSDVTGVYRISFADALAGKVPELILDASKSKYDITDLFVAEGRLFCYYSNGTKKGSYNELVMVPLSETGAVEDEKVTIFREKTR